MNNLEGRRSVWRVESRDGYGPFTAFLPRFDKSRMRHQVPYYTDMDICREKWGNFYFGFTKLESLLTIFLAEGQHREEFKKKGFVVAKYEQTEENIFSFGQEVTGQVMFTKVGAVRLEFGIDEIWAQEKIHVIEKESEFQ